MIYELAKNDYEKVRSIFTELQAYNLIIAAVIEGTSPGRIYVDDVSKPKTAFMCSVEGYYLAGYEGNATFNSGLRKLIAETIFAGDTVREGEWELDLRFLPGTWEARLEAILEGLDRPPIKFDRRHYVCRESKVDWKAQIPAGFSIQRVDEKLLTRPELTMPDHLINWMKINWGSIEDFMQKGFGFCTLHGEKVVCWCMADCVSGDACEVGIRTHPDYRRRGLATLTVAATVDYCLTHGFASVGWHCDKDNLGSVGVAEKAGFEKERDYVGYSYMFDKVDHLAVTGYYAFIAKQYREAAECYEKVFAMGDDHPHYHYHLAARAWAALGDNETAFRYLHQAVDEGLTDVNVIKNTKEFNPLHGTQAWQDLLARLERKKETN